MELAWDSQVSSLYALVIKFTIVALNIEESDELVIGISPQISDRVCGETPQR
jgi:hypothetical protein